MSYLPTSIRTSQLVYRGTLIATVFLSALLVLFNASAHPIWLGSNLWVVAIVIAYLVCGSFLLKTSHYTAASWMLILFYELVAFCTLLTWGLNAPVGILTISFAVILPSALMGARAILPVIIITILQLLFVQYIHVQQIVTPNISALSEPSTIWDVFTYSIILAIFALVSWIASNQREKALKRALSAESKLQKQKENLSIELRRESAALRLTQLRQIRELHKFALLGQSAAATLHELSSHLSVLNIDIEDLQQQHENSEAIANAKESIYHINKVVRQARQQINTYDKTEKFSIYETVQRSIGDISERIPHRKIELVCTKQNDKHLYVAGSPTALAQIITILLNNAVDACREIDRPIIMVTIDSQRHNYIISVKDNGPGIPPTAQKSVFKPITSSKSSGMGVGLYIAHHLVTNHFGGTIKLLPSETGAYFSITIPKNVVRKNDKRERLAAIPVAS